MRTLLRSLAGKLALIQTTFLMVALAAIAFTLWVSWQLEGGAGAINEAGRMRMMTYRLALAHERGELAEVKRGVETFDDMIANLRQGEIVTLDLRRGEVHRGARSHNPDHNGAIV